MSNSLHQNTARIIADCAYFTLVSNDALALKTACELLITEVHTRGIASCNTNRHTHGVLQISEDKSMHCKNDFETATQDFLFLSYFECKRKNAKEGND